MATTTNYSWTTPNDSDPFKQGASAIRTLGSAIDTSLFNITGGKNVGLVQMVATQTFTAQSTVNFDSVFNANYQNYLVTISFTGSGTSAGYIRYRAAAATLTDNIYSLQLYNAISATTPGGVSRSDSFAQLLPAYATNPTVMNLIFYSPYASGRTSYLGNGTAASTATDQTHALVSGANRVNTQIDGFQYTTASAVTLTGEARIYGLK